MKKGFTLIELLAVVVLLGILGGLATFNIMSTRTKQLQKLQDTLIDQIESSAVVYGQNNMNDIDTNCIVDSITTFCTTTTVKALIDNNYFKSTEKDDDGNIIVKNELTNENMINEEVLIYRKNNQVYARLMKYANKSDNTYTINKENS